MSEALDLFDDVGDRPEPVSVSKKFSDRTKLTAERASSRDLNDIKGEISF
jgi:hypothetical protein